MFFDQATAAEVRAAADPGDAGSHWRKEKLKDLVFRAKALRVQDQPEIVEAIEQLKALTFQVEDIAHRQAQPGYTTPWWMDGDYDETRAEEHNDRGAQLCKEKKHAEAFDEFTEAVRLAPSRAVYHANRSSCALKLGRHACARDDAAHAIERDPSHVAAHVRGANASLKMRDPNAALRLFDAALRLDPGNAAAARGKTTAAAAAGAANAERAAQTERARLGERDPLPAPSAWPDQCHCAESLLAAETVADANPDAEGPITARCEALVLCGRLERAMACSESLAKTSADRAYLRAEILWRLGAERVGDALDELNSFAAAYGSSSRNPTPTPMPRKILELGSRLTKLKELIERGEADVEDGALAEAERAFTAALKLRDQRRCGTDVSNCGSKNKNPYPNRCRGDLLRMRAIARLDRLGYGRDDDAAAAAEDDDDDFDPEGDLEECVAIDPSDHAAWRVLADVSRERGDCEEAFLRLRRAQAAAPNSAKIAQEVFAAARAARDQIRGGKGTYEGRRVPSGVDARVDSFYKILGVTASATAKQIRRGYRKAAAVWHPDKWQSGGGAALATAEKEFRRVSAAYEVLGNPSQRRAYDSDPARFESKVAS